LHPSTFATFSTVDTRGSERLPASRFAHFWGVHPAAFAASVNVIPARFRLILIPSKLTGIVLVYRLIVSQLPNQANPLFFSFPRPFPNRGNPPSALR